MKLNILIYLTGCLLCSVGSAIPTLYPTQFNYNLKNNTNSNVLADSEHASRYFVLPPNASFARVTGLNAMTANVGFCKELAQIQNYARETIGQVNELKNRELKMLSDVELQKLETQKQKQFLNVFVVQNSLQNYYSNQLNIEKNILELNELNKKYQNCYLYCGDIVRQIDIKNYERIELYKLREQALTGKNINVINQYNVLAKAVQEANQKTEIMLASLKEVREELLDLYRDYISLFDVHSQREGGRISIIYDSRWTENIQRLQRDNPNLSFEKAPTENTQIRADAYDKKNLMPHGSVMSFEFGGQSASANSNLGAYPERFSGSATLNLLAVCPMLHPEWFDLDLNREWTKPENIHFGLTVSYDYPAEFKHDLNLNYNLYKMYDIVKTQGTQGGFFNTKSWSSEKEKEIFNEAFNVEWIEQTNRGSLSLDKKLDIESDLKKQMLTRLASQLTMNSGVNKLLAAPELPKAGAQVLSKSMTGACSLNIVCQSIGLGLDVLYSVFSKTEMSQNLHQELDVDISERFTNKQVLMINNLTSYW